MSKKKKYRGSKTHGGGSKKKRRGAGSRGGRGNIGEKEGAGKGKGRPKGERGFKRPESAKKEVKTINLKELDLKIEELAGSDAVNTENEPIEVSLPKLGYDKLLGGGKVSRPIKVKAENFSSGAKEKLEEAGGEVVELS